MLTNLDIFSLLVALIILAIISSLLLNRIFDNFSVSPSLSVLICLFKCIKATITDDPHADQLRLLVSCYGQVLHDTGPIHQRRGLLSLLIPLQTAPMM